MRMDGKVGGWTIQPDQMQVINPFLILLFIPLFETVIYPLLAKVGLLKKPLQRLVTGGILAGLAFIISAIVELQIEVCFRIIYGNFLFGMLAIRIMVCDICSGSTTREILILKSKSREKYYNFLIILLIKIN